MICSQSDCLCHSGTNKFMNINTVSFIDFMHMLPNYKLLPFLLNRSQTYKYSWLCGSMPHHAEAQSLSGRSLIAQQAARQWWIFIVCVCVSLTCFMRVSLQQLLVSIKSQSQFQRFPVVSRVACLLAVCSKTLKCCYKVQVLVTAADRSIS